MDRDVLIIVFQYLEQNEFPAMLLVCRKWNRVANDPVMFRWHVGHPTILDFLTSDTLELVHIVPYSAYDYIFKTPEIWKRTFPAYPQIPHTYSANMRVYQYDILPELVFHVILQLSIENDRANQLNSQSAKIAWRNFDSVVDMTDMNIFNKLDLLFLPIISRSPIFALILKIIFDHYISPHDIFGPEIVKAGPTFRGIVGDKMIYGIESYILHLYDKYPEIIDWNYDMAYWHCILPQTIMESPQLWDKINWALAMKNMQFPESWLEEHFFIHGSKFQNIPKSYICIGQQLSEEFIDKWFTSGPYNNTTNWDMIFNYHTWSYEFIYKYRHLSTQLHNY